MRAGTPHACLCGVCATHRAAGHCLRHRPSRPPSPGASCRQTPRRPPSRRVVSYSCRARPCTCGVRVSLRRACVLAAWPSVEHVRLVLVCKGEERSILRGEARDKRLDHASGRRFELRERHLPSLFRFGSEHRLYEQLAGLLARHDDRSNLHELLRHVRVLLKERCAGGEVAERFVHLQRQEELADRLLAHALDLRPIEGGDHVGRAVGSGRALEGNEALSRLEQHAKDDEARAHVRLPPLARLGCEELEPRQPRAHHQQPIDVGDVVHARRVARRRVGMPKDG
mmetsp:Transcript_12316/g.31490  ORF Transcript_12316/g.31490 Transcript_12316/m.31490 type:complete len:284 (-) Transcript_12316:789-1640(-)